MQTVSDGYNTTGVRGQVFSWIDDPVARVAAPGLHGRSVLSDLDLSRADVEALVETALWLKTQRERARPHPCRRRRTSSGPRCST